MTQTTEGSAKTVAEKIATPGAPRLLDLVSDTARQQGQSDEVTKETAQWCRRFVLFHGIA